MVLRRSLLKVDSLSDVHITFTLCATHLEMWAMCSASGNQES